MSAKGSDIIAIVGKGLVGAVPFVGPLAAEIIGAVIPNQRIDRIESFLKVLESKIAAEDQSKIESSLKEPEFVDLVEDSFIQASRALSDERKGYIASLLKNGLTDEGLEYIEYKRLFSTLGELNDLEILILKSYSLRRDQEGYDEFFRTHGDALTPPRAYIGAGQDAIDKSLIYNSHRSHLVRLDLLRPRHRKPKRGEFPEFDDKTGMIKAVGYEITGLGRLLLKGIDEWCVA